MNRLLRHVFAALLAGAILVGGALLYGAWRWSARTRAVRANLEASRDAARTAPFDPRAIADLPDPARRYLNSVLHRGQPVVLAARMRTEGSFLMDPSKGAWAPFSADQAFVARPPGFDWDARIRMGAGISVFVRDAYVRGAGTLRADVAGLTTAASQEGGGDLARGELLRWLAETCWFPTALLPGGRVRWEAVDERRARAIVEDHGVTAALEFRFGADGLVASVFAPDRPRLVAGTSVPTPWEGTWGGWSPRNGMTVPSFGEVAWVLPEGRLPYWRGRIASVSYTFAPPEDAPPRGD